MIKSRNLFNHLPERPTLAANCKQNYTCLQSVKIGGTQGRAIDKESTWTDCGFGKYMFNALSYIPSWLIDWIKFRLVAGKRLTKRRKSISPFFYSFFFHFQSVPSAPKNAIVQPFANVIVANRGYSFCPKYRFDRVATRATISNCTLYTNHILKLRFKEKWQKRHCYKHFDPIGSLRLVQI